MAGSTRSCPIDAATLSGPLGVRPARAGERLGQGPYDRDLVPGRLVLADAERPVGALFGPSRRSIA